MKTSAETSGKKSKPMNIRVVIVEDNNRVRGSLARLIELTDGFESVGEYASGEDALAALPKLKPDVVLMDINLPGINGVDCVRQLKPVLPQTQVVMLTVYENTDLIFQALAAGATGYLLKQTPPAELLTAVRDVHQGGSPMTSHIARKVVASFQQTGDSAREFENLTTREREVLEIAEAMSISYDTVHTHIRKVYEKLHVRSRTEAVAKHLGRATNPGLASTMGR
jgi:DNA-binding NarL/FixJ family response regulator